MTKSDQPIESILTLLPQGPGKQLYLGERGSRQFLLPHGPIFQKLVNSFED